MKSISVVNNQGCVEYYSECEDYSTVIISKVNIGVVSRYIFKHIQGNNVVILLDNAKIHRSKLFKSYTDNNNINLLFNVPYSPETNPIEMVFSKVKNIVKSRDNSTEDKITKSVANANKSVIKRELTNFYKKSFSQ